MKTIGLVVIGLALIAVAVFMMPWISPGTTSDGASEVRPNRQITMRDLVGRYSSTSNGVTVTVRIYNADADTAYATISSTNSGTQRCAAVLLDDVVLFVFADGDEVRFRRIGTTGLQSMNGVTLRRL